MLEYLQTNKDLIPAASQRSGSWRNSRLPGAPCSQSDLVKGLASHLVSGLPVQEAGWLYMVRVAQ